MEKIHESIRRYPLFLILVLFCALLFSLFTNEKSFLEIKHPPKSEYPWFYFINNIYENSTLTSGILKILYDKLSLEFIAGIILLYIYDYFINKNFFLSDIIYLLLLFTFKLVFHFYFSEWKLVLEMLEVPFILMLYSYFFKYVFNVWVGGKFTLFEARNFFLDNYGKVFIFVFVLNLGIESLPFDELSIYSQKYGFSTAWGIISYRNLIFDILFFALVWSYLPFLSLHEFLSIILSFTDLNRVLKENKLKIFVYGLVYYSYISLITLLDFYFELKQYKLILLFPTYFLLLDRIYKLVVDTKSKFFMENWKKQNERSQQLANPNSESEPVRRKTQKPKRTRRRR